MTLSPPPRPIYGELLEFFKGILKKVLSTAVDLTASAFQLVKKVAKKLFGALRSILNIRINIPGVTWLIETLVLEGDSLTIGRLLCLIPAVPSRDRRPHLSGLPRVR